MKKIYIILVMILFVVSVNAQRGKVQTLATATLNGNETKTLAEIPVTGSYESVFVSLTVTRVSTAAGGVLYLKAGMDSASAKVMTTVLSPSTEFFVNDTMTTTDVATQYFPINITEPGAKYYSILGDGDVNDTVSVVTKVLLK